MPVKRRHAKRRFDQQAEMVAWSGLFKCGYDYFDELAGWGKWTPDDADRSKRAAAKDAWARLGAAFLNEWRAGGLHGRPMAVPLDTLWALAEFGEPPRHGR